MTDANAADEGGVRRRGLPWYLFGLANFGIVLGLSLAFWYLLVDPAISPFATYPEPFFVVLFWTILSVVFLGFNLEFFGFDGLGQPVRGLVIMAASIGLGLAITALITLGIGGFDPTFSASRADGLGFVSAELYVLIGFFTYLTLVINWGHWPWRNLGLSQPWLGVTEILAATGITILAYAMLVLPSVAVWAEPGNVLLELNTTIGWFYCVIVSAIITGLLTENWPWRLAGPGGPTALASLVGNFVFGTVIFFIHLAVVRLIIGSETVAEMGPVIMQFPAQLGVCWVFWMVLWANAFGNKPTELGAAANYLVRIAVTFGLGIVTFVLYYYVFAGAVLNEPALAGSLYGNALGWMDWMVLWLLFYVVCLGSYGLPAEPEVSADEPESVREELAEEPTQEPKPLEDTRA
ncbi:MAG: hypothetical protein ACRDSJ_05785 [Rubrobacteraceae bacterium]